MNATVKSVINISAITVLSRILGLAREQLRAIYLGTGMGADAFGIAFLIPNLLRQLAAEGAMNAAFVPVFAYFQQKKTKEELWTFTNNFFVLVTFILTGITIISIIIAPFLIKYIFAGGFVYIPGKAELAINLTRIMCVYILLIGLAAICQGILNSFKIFTVPAFSPVLLNISIITCALLFSNYFSNPAYAFAIGVVIGGFAQLSIQLKIVLKMGLRFKPSRIFENEGVRRVFKLMVPSLWGIGIYEVNVSVSQMIATYIAPGAVSSLQYSSRILELTLGVFVVSISTVILPKLSKEAALDKISEIKRMVLFAVRIVSFITIPASVGLIVLSKPIVGTIFKYGEFGVESLNLTSFALKFHAAGLLFIGFSRVMVTLFYSMKDTVTPVKISTISMVVNVLGCVLISPILGNGGIALANSIAAMSQVISILFYCKRTINYIPITYDSILSFIKILLAALIMGIFANYFSNYFNIVDQDSLHRFFYTLLSILLSIGIYAAILHLLSSYEMKEFIRLVVKRKSGSY